MPNTFAPIVPLAKRLWWRYLLGIAALIVSSGLQLTIPRLIGRSIDAMSAEEAALPLVTRLMTQLLAVALVVGIARFLWRHYIHGASRRIEHDLRSQLFAHLTGLPKAYHQRAKTGDLMARLTQDLEAVRMATGMALVAFVDGVFMTVAIVVILIAQGAELALVLVVPLPFITVLMVVVGRLVRPLFGTAQASFAKMSDQVQETLAGIRVVKSFRKEPFFTRRFTAVNEEYARNHIKLVHVWGLFGPIVQLLSGLTVVLLLWFGGRLVFIGELSMGQFVATLGYLQMLVWPVMGAGYTVNMIQRGAAALDRIGEILAAESTIVAPATAGRPDTTPSIVYRHAHVDYDERAGALQDLSFELHDGEILGVIGSVGAGKTTMLELAPRLLDPASGTVHVAGLDVQRWDLAELRRQFGYVPQSTFLFSATLADNIRFARPAASDEEVQRFGLLAGLGPDLAEFPHGWQTVVGERGVTLSGGQRQRVAIARALLARPTYLLLDDALSAVDAATERSVIRALAGGEHANATILVSNRISALKSADHIVVLEAGRVSDQGRHEELIAREGLYRSIAAIQGMVHAT